MLDIIDVVLVLSLAGAVAVLSVMALIRAFKRQRGGYDQISLLPERWRRWVLDEKSSDRHSR